MLYIDQTMGQFWEHLASMITVKRNHVVCAQMFNTTTTHTLHCKEKPKIEANSFQKCPITRFT